ncbi:transcriptional repressor [Patescibacteria group bacterium]|nr:transcriptional repressor [Patescibacteria group bacterium]
MYNELLKTSGLSVTQQRLSILNALSNFNQPATIEQLAQTIDIHINTSTIYRSLRVLVDAGIVYQTDFRDGVSYFEFQEDHHHHVVCTSCGKQERIDVCIGTHVPKIEKSTGYTITNHMLEFFGLCKNCS